MLQMDDTLRHINPWLLRALQWHLLAKLFLATARRITQRMHANRQGALDDIERLESCILAAVVGLAADLETTDPGEARERMQVIWFGLVKLALILQYAKQRLGLAHPRFAGAFEPLQEAKAIAPQTSIPLIDTS